MTQATFEIKSGVSFELELQLLAPDGAPVDMTGCGLRAQVREKPGAALVHDFAQAGGLAFVDAALGMMRLSISAADSRKFNRPLRADLLVDWPREDGGPARVTCAAEFKFMPDATVTE